MHAYYSDDLVTLYHGDALDVLRSLPDASVDAVVTDPPYGLEFMGKDWDAPWSAGAGIGGHSAGFSEKRYKDGSTALVPNYTGGTNPTCRNCGGLRNGREGKKGQQPCRCGDPKFDNVTLPRMRAFQEWCGVWAVECLRVLKPGGHLLAFGGTRTVHRLTCAIEDAGFEIRDGIDWLYASGFPKSLDVSKAIDKAAGATPVVVGQRDRLDQSVKPMHSAGYSGGFREQATALDITGPATDDARRWSGWGTALKPAREPIVMARKPLAGTVVANVAAHCTGALNIDACRVGDDTSRGDRYNGKAPKGGGDIAIAGSRTEPWSVPAGRWPSNVVLSHAPDCTDVCLPGCPVAELDRQSGVLTSGANPTRRHSPKFGNAYGEFSGGTETPARGADSGGASRFFPVFRYQAKAPTRERPRVDGIAHPTVKPLELMRWLVRLVTPPGGVVLEPFAGSGTTVEACLLEGFHCVAIEREATYLPLIEARLNRTMQPALDLGGAA